MGLLQYLFVLLDVFDDIEGADHVELALVWNPACIHLEKVRRGESPGRKTQSFQKDLATTHPQIGQAFGDATQYVTGTASDFEHVARARKEALQHVDDQLVSCPEPEMAFFQSCEARKVFGAESRGFMRQRG